MRTSLRPLMVTLAFLLPTLEACLLGTSTTGSSGSTGSPGSTADGGATAPCETDGGCTATGPTSVYSCASGSDCLGMKDTACTTTATCTAGVCAFTYAAKGTVSPSQSPGDCRQNQCDGQGNVEEIADDTDIPAATNDCAAPQCSSGTLTDPPKAEATLCSSNGGRTCDGSGVCRYCARPDAACDQPAGNPATANNTQATAYDFGNIGDDDGNGKEVCGVLKAQGAAEADWYKYGGYTEYVLGVSAYKNDPSASVYSTTHAHVCIYTSCGPADFICPAGTTLDIAAGGQRGCCQEVAPGGAGMDIPSSCSGPEVWMSVQSTDPTTCAGYDLKFHF